MRSWYFIGLLIFAVIAVGLAAFGFGIFPRVEQVEEAGVVSPEAASSAEVKLARLRNDGEEARLSAIELTSLFRFRPEIWALGPVVEPTVQMTGDMITVRGSVPIDAIPADAQLDAFRDFLPDTTEIAVAGTISDVGGGSTTLEITSIEVAGMPVPASYHPMILERMGHGDGFGSSSITLPLPDVVGSARVEGGDLILAP